MRRFWVEADAISESKVIFEGDSYNHLVRVCRSQVGDRVEVVFGSDEALEVELQSIDKKKAVAQILQRRPLPKPQRPYIQLGLCFPKPAVFEAVLEKSVELGVHSIQPLFNQFSFYKSPKDIKEAKVQRWEKIIRSATEQSARGDLLKIKKPQDLLSFASTINPSQGHRGLFLYEGQCAHDLHQGLDSLPKADLQMVTALIGSEGGFSTTEVAKLQELGLLPLTMGSQILRAETACVSILSVIKYHFGQMR